MNPGHKCWVSAGGRMKKVAALALLTPLFLLAHSGKPEVISGSARYELQGNTEVLHVSDKTIVEYPKFNIEKNEAVRFEQPSHRSTVLCRVKGTEYSKIHGMLEANGKLLLVNPNGIFFSKTAQVNVGSLIASTLDIQNHDFLNDRFKFHFTHDSAIVNKGNIQAAHNVAFLAPQIVNQGVVVAKAGKIVLMGAELMTLDFDGDDLIKFAVEVPLKSGFIEQAGELTAGQVMMKLSTAHDLIKNVLNVSGIVEAGYIEIENGMVRLLAGSNTETTNLHIHADQIALNTKVDTGRLELSGRKIIQNGEVISKEQVHYTADEIKIGENIHSNGGITLDGSVVLFKNNEIVFQAQRFGNGNITFTSTLDAENPKQKLSLLNPLSHTKIMGAIGQKGALGGMFIHSQGVTFNADVGIAGLLEVKAERVESRGSHIITGEQEWHNSHIQFTQPGPVVLKTCGGKLNAIEGEMVLKNKDGFSVQTEGGVLQMAPMTTESSQPLTIQSGNGKIYLREIEGPITELHVTGEEINLDGKTEAGSIFMEAKQGIKYGHLREGESIATTVKSSGTITLNSKNNNLGTSEFPIHVQTTESLYVGAHDAAYVKGTCAGRYAHVYAPNPPPLTSFNGHETYYVFLPKSTGENESNRTIAPALAHRLPTKFIYGVELKPRHAPIYYNAAEKD